MKVIIVEGGVGVGKSTLLEQMAKFPNVGVVYEIVPLDKLKLFLEGKLDPLSFQYNMAAMRIIAQEEALKKQQGNNLVFMERSVFSDNCFAKVCIENKADLEFYKVFAKNLLWEKAVKPDAVLYLKGSLEGEAERIKKRERKGEKFYLTPEGFEYRRKLNEQHDQLALKYFADNIPILQYNPDEMDFRDIHIAHRILQDVNDVLRQRNQRYALAVAQGNEDVITS